MGITRRELLNTNRIWQRFHSTRSQADCSPANIAKNIAVRYRRQEAHELA